MKKIVTIIILLLLFSCSQVNIHENEDVCFLHIYVELPEGYQDWSMGFIQFLRERSPAKERKNLSAWVERFTGYNEKRIKPHYENVLEIKKDSFILIQDTIHFRLRGYECFLGGAPHLGVINDFMIYKKGDTIYKHYDLSDKECVPYE